MLRPQPIRILLCVYRDEYDGDGDDDDRDQDQETQKKGGKTPAMESGQKPKQQQQALPCFDLFLPLPLGCCSVFSACYDDDDGDDATWPMFSFLVVLKVYYHHGMLLLLFLLLLVFFFAVARKMAFGCWLLCAISFKVFAHFFFLFFFSPGWFLASSQFGS